MREDHFFKLKDENAVVLADISCHLTQIKTLEEYFFFSLFF